MSLTGHFYTSFFISFFMHINRNRLYAATTTIVVTVLSDTGQSSFSLFLVLIQAYLYGFTYIRLTSFILSVVYLNTISNVFVAIIENKVSLCFFGSKSCFYIATVFFFQYKQSHFMSLTDVIWNRLSPVTAIVVPLVLSDNSQSSFGLLVILIHSYAYVGT